MKGITTFFSASGRNQVTLRRDT